MSKPKKTKTPPGVKCTREFEFNLTEAEFSEKGKAAAALSREVSELDLQFEEVKEGWKAKIKTREAKRDEILGVINAKKEKRMVDAVLVKNYEAKEIEYWFDGQILEKRTMTIGECQVEADFTAGKKARAIRQKLQKQGVSHAELTGEAAEKSADIAEVHKQETGRRTKLSAVDGPATGSHDISLIRSQGRLIP